MSIFRRGCVVCGRGASAICRRCTSQLLPPPSTRVRGVGRVDALFGYEGTGAAVVQALKFRDGRRLVGPLADGLARLALDPIAPSPVAVTWLPTSTHRRHDRGFDQAELLARAVARRLECPAVSTLRRSTTESQTGRGRADREGNVAFSTSRAVGGGLLVIDDVCTTGATIRAADRALAGTGHVGARYLTVARTP